MDIHRIASWDDLVALRPEWNALAHGVPFRRWEWLATWWKFYGDSTARDQDLFVLAVYDDDSSEAMGLHRGSPISDHNHKRRLVGIAPWMLRRSTAMGTAIEFLGEEEVCSDYPTVLSDLSRNQRIAAALADYLTAEFQSWDVLSLYGFDDDDTMVTELVSAMKERGFESPLRQPAFQSWCISLPESWDEYSRVLSKSHRKHDRRALRRVDEIGGSVFRTVRSREEFDATWPVLVTLHQKRWQSRDEPGCFASSRFSAFQREVAAMMLESGNLRLSVVEVNDEPIAADYSLTGCETTYAYQSGIDPDQMSLEPGRLSMIASIQQAIEEGKTSFDFLRGDEPYKPHWRAQPKQAWHTRIVNRHAMARLRDAGWRAARTAKHWIKAKVRQDGATLETYPET